MSASGSRAGPPIPWRRRTEGRRLCPGHGDGGSAPAARAGAEPAAWPAVRWRSPHAARAAAGRALALAVAVLPLVSGCSLLYKQPAVRSTGVRVTELGLTDGVLRVRLEVSNPNRYGLEVRSVEYRLEVEGGGSAGAWRELAAGVRADAVRIGARGTAEMEVDVPFRYAALGAAVRALLERGSVRYRVRGAVRVAGPLGSVTVPFRSEGELVP